MSITKKFYEIERGLIVGPVSVDADTGEITTTGHVNLNSLNLNDNFVVTSNGNTVIDGTVLINSKSTLESLEVINDTAIDGSLTVIQDTLIQQDLTVTGDFKTTNQVFNLLNDTVDIINMGANASTIAIGKVGTTCGVTLSSNVLIGRDLTLTRSLFVADNKFRFDSTYNTEGKTTLTGELQVGQYSLFQNDVTINGSLQVDTNTTITGNTNITGYLKVIDDFNINDKLTVAHSTGNLNTLGNISATGTLTSTGNFTTADIVANGIESSATLTKIKSTNVEISDTIVYLGTANTGALKDIGFIGHFNNGTYQHTGLLRDATDNVWKLFSNAIAEITDTVDVTGVVYDAFKAGNITSTDTITATTQVVTPDVLLPNARLTGKTLTLGAWIIQEDPNNGGSLFFKYNGTTVFSISSAGIVTAAQDITSYGTPA